MNVLIKTIPKQYRNKYMHGGGGNITIINSTNGSSDGSSSIEGMLLDYATIMYVNGEIINILTQLSQLDSKISNIDTNLKNQLENLKTRIQALEGGGGSSGGDDSGGSGGDTPTPDVPSGIDIVGSVTSDNKINVTGVSGDYTLQYIDSTGNILSNYEEITL